MLVATEYVPIPEIRELIREVYPHVAHDPDITEHVFVYIETHPRLLQRYNGLRRTYGTPVNQWMGREIREMYQLPNTGRSKTARTTLITSYTRH